jgi:hypothetical protein
LVLAAVEVEMLVEVVEVAKLYQVQARQYLDKL